MEKSFSFAPKGPQSKLFKSGNFCAMMTMATVVKRPKVCYRCIIISVARPKLDNGEVTSVGESI